MQGGRTKKAVINIGANFLNQIISLLMAFVSRTIFIKTLGIEYLGINGLFSDVLGLLSLADLGMGTAMAYSFYKPLAEHDERKIAALISFYRRIYIIIAFAVASLGICIIPILPYVVNVEHEIPNLMIFYLLSLANIVASYIYIYKTSVLTADQKGYKVAKVNMYVSVLRTILQVITLIILKSFIVFLIIAILATIFNNIYASYIADKEYPFLNCNTTLADEEKKGVLRNIGNVFIYKLSSMLMNTTDNILISVIVGTAAVGIYSNYFMIQNKIYVFYSLFFSSLTAGIGNLIATDTCKKRYEVFKCEQVISMIGCGVIVPCFVSTVNDLIAVWIGSEYMLSFATVVAMGINIYFSCVLQPLWSYREATGLYKKTKWIMLLCASLNIVLSVVLGRKFGIMGILLASAVSRLATYVWYEPKLLMKDYFEQKPFSYYKQLASNAIIIIILSFISVKAADHFAVDNYLFLFLKMGIIALSCAIVIIAVYSKSEGFTLLKNKCLHYVDKIKKFTRNK